MNKQSENEIIITFPKLWDNIKRYWWILMAGVLASVMIIFFPTLLGGEEDPVHVKGEATIYIKSSYVDSEENLSIIIGGIKNQLSDAEVPSLTEAVKKQMSTKKCVDEIQEKLNGIDGTSENIQDLNVELETSGKMIVCTLEGNDQESVVSFLNAYVDVFSEKMNLLLQQDEAVVIQRAEKENLIVETETGMTKVFMKTLFLVMLCLLASFVVIFFLTMKDAYIRDKKEILELENVPVLGKVQNKGQINRGSDFILPLFLQRHQIERAILVSVGGKCISQNLLEQMCECCNKEFTQEVVTHAINVRKSNDELKKIDGFDVVVLVICVNDDKIKEVQSVVQSLLALDKKIAGVVYVYS